jgi:signal transduction histidine kinase/ActR/RegA family two-component response regulator
VNSAVALISSWPVISLEALGGLLIAFLAYKSWTWRRVRLEDHGRELTDAVERRTRELAVEKERAEAANRLTSQFLENISHEIRTPMNGVLGTLELALTTELTREQREYMELSRSSAEALLALLDDILDFSKIEAEKLQSHPVAFSLGSCLRGVIGAVTRRAAEKGLDLRTEIARNVPDNLYGDPDHLRPVLLKIVENAIKFSSSGSIVVGVKLDDQRPEHSPASGESLALLFSVQDRGIGISKHKQGQIFEPFQQVDGSVTRKYGGTGLGLAICGRLVRLMHGRIWLDSEDGKGSKFFFTARFGVPQRAEITAPAPPPVPKKAPVRAPRNTRDQVSVLLAEDNRINQIVTARLLQKRGFRTILAKNGREAFEMLEREPVDLVLMDVQMPEMDGFEATRRIREQEKKTGAHLPIVAMTAHALDGDREKCLDAGMDAYLAKPVQSAQLYKMIEEMLAPTSVNDAPVVAPLTRVIN